MIRHRNNSRAVLAAPLLVSGLLATALAQAQAHSDDSPTADASGNVLQEVVVTSRKREERLQDIPESVSAFDAKAIEDARIENISDAIELTPSVTIIRDQQPGSESIAIRGVGQNRSAEPPVAFVVDGVALANPYEFTQQLFDIERIEVLKGPQGSLYGRNAIGGAINITTRAPTDQFEGGVSLRAARGNEFKFGGSLSGPIVRDKAYFRISGMLQDTDGLIENVTLGRKVDDFKDRSVRGKLLLTPNESLRIDLTGFYDRYRGGGGWWAPATLSPFGWNSSVGVPQGDVLGRAPRNHKSVSLKVDYDFTPVTLTSISSGVDLKETLYQDFDMTPESVLEGTAGERFKSVTQEFRLTSKGTGALRWVGGVFFQHTKRERQTDVFINLNAPAPFGAGTGDPASKSLAQIADIPSERTYDAYAAFGQADYKFSEALTGTLGLRYDTEDRKQQVPVGPPKAKFHALQPKASLAYEWHPGLLGYATVARGYRPGGFNDAAAFGVTYDQESLWSYELGMKSTLLEDHLILNVAAYHERFDNQQFFIVDGSAQQAIINGKKTEINGVEFDFRALPLAGLEFSGGMGYNDTDIKDFGNFTGAAFDTDAFAGNKIPQVPAYNLTLSAQYTHPVAGELRLQERIDFHQEGKVYWHPDNATSRGSYSLADARISLDSDKWRVSLFGENIFNKKYINSQFDNPWTGIISGVGIAWTPPPRTYGVEASMKF